MLSCGPTVPARAIATRAFPPEKAATVRTSIGDNCGNRRFKSFSTRSSEEGSSLTTRVPSGSSSLMSYSIVTMLRRLSGVRQRSASLSWSCAPQLSITKIAGTWSAIRSTATVSGGGDGLSARFVYNTIDGSSESAPMRVSKRACTKRVLPTPDNPTRRTILRGSRSTLRRPCSPSSAIFPVAPSIVPLLTRSASSRRYSPVAPCGSYAQAP